MIRTEQLNALIGKNIELVCFAKYSVYIHLEDKIILTLEAGFEHIHQNTRQVQEASSAFTESTLMTILESTVTSATIQPSGDLLLTISNGDSLRIYKEPQFESYRIRIHDEESIA